MPFPQTSRGVALLLASLAAAASLASCGGPSSTVTLGPGKLQGVLRPAPLSRIRRGTHLMEDRGTVMVYLESNTVNLSAYDGRIVSVEGVVEKNTDPNEAPVMVVSSLEPKDTALFRDWTFVPVQLSFSVPSTWVAVDRGEVMDFRSASGSVASLLTIFLQSSHGTPFATDRNASSSSPSSLERHSFLVGSYRAVRQTQPSGSMTVYIDRGISADIPPEQRIITLAFGEEPEDSSFSQDIVYAHFLSSLHLGRVASSSSARPSRSSTSAQSSGATGGPCGGPAGILCPPGYLCEVTDRATDIGRCRPL